MTVIEVVDREIPPLACVESGEGRGAARLVGKTGAGRPKQRRRGYRLKVEIVPRDVHVRRLRLAVEVHREPIRREDLAEDERRRERGIGPDPSRVDPEFGERAPDV